MHGGAAQRVDTDLEAGRADRVHVDDIDKVGDVGCDVIVARDTPRCAGPLMGYAAACQPVSV